MDILSGNEFCILSQLLSLNDHCLESTRILRNNHIVMRSLIGLLAQKVIVKESNSFLECINYNTCVHQIR